MTFDAHVCPNGHATCPGHALCPECGDPQEGTIDLTDRIGEVVTWTTSTATPPGVREPNTLAIVEFDVSDATEGPDGDKDRIAAALLGIFLGGLGAHRFYLGDIGRGILYLCFSWTLIPVLIGLIEGIIYLTKSDEEFQREHAD